MCVRAALCQGDVLTGVPVSLYRKYPPKREGDYSTAAKERMVMIYNHPCSIYEGSNLARFRRLWSCRRRPAC